MSEKIVVKQNGLSFLAILALIFITLKLCGVINWSWWLVTLPLWGGVALGLSIVIITLVFAAIAGTIAGVIDRVWK